MKTCFLCLIYIKLLFWVIMEKNNKDEVDDFDDVVDYDDDEVANQTCKIDVDVLEKEAKHVVQEYSCSLSRQLSIDE